MTWEGPRPQLSKPPVVRRETHKKSHDPTVWFLGVLLAAHVLIWTIVPALTQPNVPEEMLKLLTLGRTFELGYHDTPPLAPWLASAACALSAPDVWPAYLLAQICTIVCMWAAWKLGREFLHPWTALCAAVALEGCYFYSLTSPALTPGHVARCFWAVTVLAFHRALTRSRRRYWVATGLGLGLGILTHYGTVLLLVSMFAFTAVNDRARKCWDSSWPILAAICMAGILVPHTLWLWQHDFGAVISAFESSGQLADHLVSPVQFGISQLAAIIPMFLLLAPLINWFSMEEIRDLEPGDPDRDFARQYLLWVTVLPPCVMIAASLFAGIRLDWLSGTSLWTFAGVLFLLWNTVDETRFSWRNVLLRSATAAGCCAALLIALNVFLPEIQQQGSAVHFPGSQLAQAAEDAWSSAYEGSPRIVGGNGPFARNAGWYSTHGPAVFADLDLDRSPGMSEELLAEQGCVLVWDQASDSGFGAEELAERFPLTRVDILEPVEIPWHAPASGAPPISVGLALVHPFTESAVPATPPPPTTPATSTTTSTTTAEFLPQSMTTTRQMESPISDEPQIQRTAFQPFANLPQQPPEESDFEFDPVLPTTPKETSPAVFPIQRSWPPITAEQPGATPIR